MLPRSRAPALSVRRANAPSTTALAPTVVQGQKRDHQQQQRQAAYLAARQSRAFFRPSGRKAVPDKAAAERAAAEKAAADKAVAEKAAAEKAAVEAAAAEAACRTNYCLNLSGDL